jgi:hypothetical protein
MRKETPLADKATARPFSRAQFLALVVGLLQIIFSSLPILPMDMGHKALHIGTGLAGVVLAWRHEYARLYGIALLLLYGRLLVADIAASTAPLQLPTLEGLSNGRAALAGLVIAVVPSVVRR